MAEAAVPGEYDNDELLRKLHEWGKRIDAHRSQWSEEARESFDYAVGRPWTDDELAEMRQNFKVPVTFDLVGPLLDAVAGAEIAARQRVQYFPREVNDSAVDEVITQGANWIMDQCGGDQEDSDAFKDLLICGEGWTETRPEADMETEIIKERVDPLEMGVDPSSFKRNYSDARYIRRRKPIAVDEARDIAREMGWDEGVFAQTTDSGISRPTVVDPSIRYTNGLLGDGLREDEVYLEEWQWWEFEKRHKIILADGTSHTLTEEEVGIIPPEGIADRMEVKERCYYQAIIAGDRIVEARKLDIAGFSYQAMTGKRDRNRRYWYGLVRPMKDPQRWVNKLYSQLIEIMRSNSQGGLMIERDTTDDIVNLEETFANPSAITVFEKGSLENGRVKEKPVAQYPAGLHNLMDLAKNMMRDTTGINQELLGLADRQQPGVLEHQRKQAAYGILSPFFDALSSYRRTQGKILLQMMRLYLPPSKLVRVVGEDGGAQYVPLALDQSTAEYDVIVDEAPNSPNQKAQIFQVLVQMMPMLQNAEMPMTFWSEILKYCPLPASLSQKISTMLTEQEQAQQQAMQAEQEQQQAMLQQAQVLGVEQQQAETFKTVSDAEKAQAGAHLDMARAFEVLNPQQGNNDE